MQGGGEPGGTGSNDQDIRGEALVHKQGHIVRNPGRWRFLRPSREGFLV
jgi:hypothetical protein